MSDSQLTKQDVDQMRENYRAKVFRMMLHIAAIFGVPAILAFWLGGMLDLRFGSDGDTWRVILLGIAFVSSWVWVFRLYSKLNKESKDIEAKAKEIKESK